MGPAAGDPISLGGAARTRLNNVDPDLLDAGSWQTSIDSSRRAFVRLWLYKHGTWDTAFIASIESADVEIDFGLAVDILRGFPGLSLELVGSSLEAYVALLFLGLVLDPRAMETVRCTGILGHEIENKRQRGGDRWVLHPHDVQRKVRLTLCLPNVEHLLIARPRERARKPLPRYYSRGHLRISDSPRCLSDMADLVFGQKWRKHRNERCPDVAFAFKEKSSDADKEQARAAELLGGNDPVLELPHDVTVAGLAQALKSAADRAAKADAVTDGQAKAASFTFVRTLEGKSPRTSGGWYSTSSAPHPRPLPPYCASPLARRWAV